MTVLEENYFVLASVALFNLNNQPTTKWINYIQFKYIYLK